jgi:hypothetical protein
VTTSNHNALAKHLVSALKKKTPGLKVTRRGGIVTITPADAVPRAHQAKSSGALGVPERGCFPVHQCSGGCGGEFLCDGCNRVVGWCRGAADDIGPEHCDDCYCDRLAVLELIRAEGQQTRSALKWRVGDKAKAWQRDPVTVARELCEDGFLTFNGAGRFALTPRGREALS